MKLAIMFCNIPEIEIRNIPDSIDNVEEYIEEDLGYNPDELTWQCYEDNDVKVRIV